MAYSLIWLPEILRNAGLKVAEVEGWANRGRADMGRVRGVMCHHTGTSTAGNMPTLNMLKTGRSDLPGPLSQLGLGRDGTYYVVAAGRANHAGGGQWRGVLSGNASFIGIEAENGGRNGDAWPEVQMDSYWRGVAAILKHIGAGAEMCCGHKEYALPIGRKPDPLFEMNVFRSNVRSVMQGTAVTRPLIPATDTASGKTTLRRGARGADVKVVQKQVGVLEDGRFGPSTEAAVRAFQAGKGLVPDGIVGPKTWTAILSRPQVVAGLSTRTRRRQPIGTSTPELAITTLAETG
ncbi:N-acetylmuramoyl-L-alanine amidase [Sinorhizobium meliloti]|uniref:peptidoglycan recognition protein family protein n=1 Tax=Rhizobium meliloti TaxID=382 RepID=UPI00299D46D4|nr:N-acetylmuramoyl-L-alanine amidase [Sinorhizobium meliloti]MDX0066123.1 N-acetylmuramoyl-L-alanine amidase [Sinorhizobium meliloti]MDX0084506.1 N-acetylmuramoyl-L-alanine amidase [Sinorhizobium meliloti]MDX0722941.1 N-acetylmuramoyl-L-alanine amidase [Sinorhizobium medicae]